MAKTAQKKKPALIFASFIIITLVASIIIGLFYAKNYQTHKSIVIRTYNNEPNDGCGGYILKDGTEVDTICFWTQPDIDVQGEINVGDRVEYRLEGKKPFIRAIEN